MLMLLMYMSICTAHIQQTLKLAVYGTLPHLLMADPVQGQPSAGLS